MSKNRLGPYSFGIAILLFISAIVPAFAEVATIETNVEQFLKGEKVKFSGTVEKNSKGVVTIVIRDGEDRFITLEQAVIDPDYTFHRTVLIDDKFASYGIYEANGFILSLEKGAETTFEISSKIPVKEIDEFPELIIPEIDGQVFENPIKSNRHISFIDKSKDPQHYVDRYYNETTYKDWFDRNYPGITIEEAVGYEESKISNVQIKAPEPPLPTQNIPDFIDKSKDPQHYVDRYYNETAYKEWFDRNYPDTTIEEAVGYEEQSTLDTKITQIIQPEIIPRAEASSVISNLPTNEKTYVAEISLAIASLGILFGAVYGVKRKVDHNSKQISLNRNILQKKFLRPLIGNDPLAILKTRLAKGQISIQEYEKLKSKIS